MVGRGLTVGRPLGLLLTRRTENATVTLCHTGTRDLAAHVRNADIVVAAAGVPGIITADMVKPGAAVLDVGVSRVDGKIAGDVAADVWDVAGWVSPNPGGVGPMTRAMLLSNIVAIAEEAGHGAVSDRASRRRAADAEPSRAVGRAGRVADARRDVPAEPRAAGVATPRRSAARSTCVGAGASSAVGARRSSRRGDWRLGIAAGSAARCVLAAAACGWCCRPPRRRHARRTPTALVDVRRLAAPCVGVAAARPRPRRDPATSRAGS